MSAQEEYEKIKAKIEQQVKYGLPETPSVTPSAQPYTEVQPTVQEEYQAIDYSGNLVNISPEGLTKRTVTYGEYTGNVSRENWWKTKGGYPEGISFNVWTDKNGNEYIEGFDGKLVTSDAFNRFNSVGWAFLPEGLTGKKGGSSLYEVVERRSKNTPGVGPAPISQMAVLIGAEGATEYAEQNKEELGVIQVTTPSGKTELEFIGQPTINIEGKDYLVTYDADGTPSIAGLPSGVTLTTSGGVVKVGDAYISRDVWKDLPQEDRNVLQTQGIDAFRQVQQQRLQDAIVAGGGQEAWDYYQSLPSADLTDEERKVIDTALAGGITAFTDNPYPQGTQEYYLFDFQKTQQMDLGEYINKIGGNYEEYIKLPTEEQQQYFEAQEKEYAETLGWTPITTEGGTQLGFEYDISGGQTVEMYTKWKSGQLTDQQWLDYVKGATARAAVIKPPPSPMDIQRLMASAVDVGADINYYNSLEKPQERIEYYGEIVDKKFIKDVEGDLDYYNSLTTTEAKNDYVKQLENEQIVKFEQFQTNVNTVQKYIDNGKIAVNEDGTYDFSKLSAFDVERDEDLKTALSSFFPTDAEGNEFDIVDSLTNAVPSYLSSADDLTDTMKRLIYNDGLQSVSLWGKTPEEKFEAMQSWGLIPIGAKYIGGTDRYIPTQEDLDSMGITIEQYKQLTMDTGGDWIYGMPVWSLSGGRLSPETINLFKTLDWGSLYNRADTGDKAYNEGRIDIQKLAQVLNEHYSGKNWDDLTEGQRQNALELYDNPHPFEQLEGGYTEIKEWIAGEPISEGQMYVGITPYNPPDPTTGIAGAQASVTNWAKTEENVGVKVFKSVAAGVASLGLGFAGMLETAYGAGQQIGAGNLVQAGKNLVGIPLGMSEFMVLQLPKDIAGDPIYGTGEIIGMFVVPEIAKAGLRTVKASFRAVDPRMASSSIYSTNPNIRFYRGSPYMTAIEFRDAFQGLQEKQRVTPDTRAISEVITTKIPENITEAKFTKVGNEYVIDGTKIDNTGNLIEVREPRYHPSANTVDDVGVLADNARIILYHVLPDGTKEYLVVKDRTGGAYQIVGGSLEIKAGSALAQVLRELFEETNLTAKNVKEYQPYLGKMHSRTYNGVRVFTGEVVDKVAFDRFLHAHEGIPEVKSAVWIKDSGFPKVQVGVMPATYDVLTGVGVPKNALKVVGVDKITDTARDLTWGERIKADRLPTEAEIKAASLKEPAIIDGQLKTMLIKTLTPANMDRPVRLHHFTHDYADLMSKAENGVITLTDANKHYNSFYTTPEPAVLYSYRNISKGPPIKHRPALVPIDVMPGELIKKGYELKWVRDGATGQYVWKIANHAIEDEITLMQGTRLHVYPPNWISKVISKGEFKDFTATSLTDNPGITARIPLQPKLVEFTGKLPEIKSGNIRKVVIDLDDTLVDVRTMKLMSGAIELLDALKSQGKELTLWTHSPKARVQEIFKRNPDLNKYFDINNKNSVISREDYTRSTDADVFKNIKAIKGDILIDNSPNQIYQQLQRGNVGLQAVDLYSIRNMLTRDDVIQSSRVSKEVPQYTTYKQGQKIPVLYLQTEAYKMATEVISKSVDKLSANKLYIEELNKQILERKKQGLPTEELESEIKRILDADVEAIKYMVDLNKLGIKDIPTTVGELYNLKGIAFREKLYDIIGGKIKPKPVKLAWHGSADSPFKNVSTSLKTKVEGLEKYGKKEKVAKEEPYKEKFKEADEYDKASDAYKKEKLKSEEELSGKEPYKIGVGESLGALLVSSGESDIEKYNKELETLNKEEASKIEEYNKEIASIREGVLEEYKSVEEVVAEVSPPEEVMGEGAITEGLMPEAGITEGVLPEAKMAEGVVPEGTMPEGIIPEGTIPEGVIPEGTIPEGVIPEGVIPEGTIPEPPPPPSLYGVILGSGGKPLTQEQKLGAIGWKQGIMYKYIYPPYGQEDIINSRSPIQGIPMKEGIRSAYETIIRTRPGFIPPNITRHMGMMDIQITDADKNGQPEIKFMEREHRKGRGSVKKPSTAQVFTINT